MLFNKIVTFHRLFNFALNVILSSQDNLDISFDLRYNITSHPFVSYRNMMPSIYLLKISLFATNPLSRISLIYNVIVSPYYCIFYCIFLRRRLMSFIYTSGIFHIICLCRCNFFHVFISLTSIYVINCYILNTQFSISLCSKYLLDLTPSAYMPSGILAFLIAATVKFRSFLFTTPFNVRQFFSRL